MNEHFENELQRELVSLRPVPPSSALKNRIAKQLQEGGRFLEGEAPAEPRRSRGPLWLAAVCGPLAAVFVFYLLRGPDLPPAPHTPDQPAAYQQSAIATAFDDSLPSLGSYRRALLSSPESLSALLDKHAHNPSQSTPQRAGAMVFARSPSELENLLGEL
jgi:hypothetical protein